jgi:acyl-CoA thioesterase I
MLRAALAFLLLLPVCLPAAAEPAPCVAPTELLDAAPLPATAGALTLGRLRILVVGSASAFAAGPAGPETAWPLRLRDLLAERRPQTQVQVELRGGRGLVTADQWVLIEEAVRRDRPDLVLWQPGAVETMRGLETAELGQVLATGLSRLRSLGVDAVVVDQQFSRFLRANADVTPYRDALRVAAGATGAALFRRYELMQGWAESGAVDVERAPRERRGAMLDRLNDCLARAMAGFLRDGVRDARR